MARIYYARTGEAWRRGEKYAYLEERQHVGNVEWQELQPDAKGNWLREGMHDEFETFVTVGIKDGKGKASAEAIFRTFGGGVKTSRDVWAYNFNYEALVDNINRTIDFYNDQVYKWQNTKRQIADVDTFVINDDRQISWSRDLKADLQRGKLSEFSEDKVRKALYRPFTRSNLFFDRILNEEVYVFPSIFPVAASDVENRVFCATGVGAERPFASLMSNSIPDLNFFGPGTVPQWFPFYTYDEDGTNRRENITDWALEKFRAHYADESISKWDIFHYAYAVLHHPLYRERYAANLKRELPRLPFAPDFRAFAAAGKSLAELHVGYERQPAYPLERVEQPGAALDWRVERMKLGKDGRTLRYNEFLTLSGIPAEAFDYRLGNRSALEWIVDQYQVSTDRRSGITNDPNRADDPEYIVRLVGQVVRVSVETVKLVRSLPRLGIAEG